LAGYQQLEGFDMIRAVLTAALACAAILGGAAPAAAEVMQLMLQGRTNPFASPETGDHPVTMVWTYETFMTDPVGVYPSIGSFYAYDSNNPIKSVSLNVDGVVYQFTPTTSRLDVDAYQHYDNTARAQAGDWSAFVRVWQFTGDSFKYPIAERSLSGATIGGYFSSPDYSTAGFRWDKLSIVSLGSGAVPEPSVWGMMVAGFALVGIGLRRRRAALGLAPVGA
jgi:hypothetical protein